MSVYLSLALLLSFSGTVAIYLASRHQLWLSRKVAVRPSRRLGLGLILLSLIILLNTMQSVAALFLLLVWVMLLLVLFPYLGAAKALRKTKP